MTQINSIVVAGSGVLGGQIAYHSAFKGKHVTVLDINDAALEQCRKTHQSYAQIYMQEFGVDESTMQQTQQRISYTTNMAEAVKNIDLVIEAVPEEPSIKTEFYQQLSQHIDPDTYIATNTSTLLPSDFVSLVPAPDKYCALHFANYIWRFNFTEVMAHPGTSEQTLTDLFHFSIDIGMVPIPIQKENNAYLLNSWGVPLVNAAITLVVNGVGDVEDVDRSFLLLNKGCEMGPLAMADMVGTNTLINIFNHWGDVAQDEQMLKNAAYIQEHYADTGKTGVLSGEGFYRYPNPAFEQPDFLEIPSLSAVPELVEKALQH